MDSGGWNTIESDAGVFTYLIENLGVKNVQFEELISLDSDTLKQQSPVYGVIFLFKYPTNQKRTDKPLDGEFDYEAAEDLFFAGQTIQNACGTQAILSVILNKEDEMEIGDQLREFREFTRAFPSELRGEALSNSELIRSVHNSFSCSSPFINETQRAASEDDDVYHFIAYTSISGKLYELDGLQPAPISHGDCSFEEFPDKVIPVLQRRIARYPPHEIRFNLLAVVRDLRLKARELGDEAWLHQEEQKRNAWQWENSLRRHNFIGFIEQTLRRAMRTKLSSGTGVYVQWIEEANKKTREHFEEKAEKKNDARTGQ